MLLSTMSERELANSVLNEILKKDGKITYPIDPFKLLQEKKVIITYSNFEKLEGIIINDEDNTTIVSVNRQRPWTRQRFTAAHEYCHFIKDLKRNKNEFSQINCLTKTNNPIEKYADNFASELLMPIEELKKVCYKYKNANGFISFDDIVYIAEYFGVSFESCLFRIAYKLNMIDGDIDSVALKKRIKQFKPDKRRKELLNKSNDTLLIGNIINSLSYCMVDLSSNIGSRFLNKYIYYDNKLENVEQKNVSYILADLQYNNEKSKFYNSDDENIYMTLGNYKMQEYVINTNDIFEIKKCCMLHKMLFAYAPYPEYAGFYRNNNAVLRNGTTQPVDWNNICSELDMLETEFCIFKNQIYKLNVSCYIEKVAYFIYKFLKIHPFSDGNGRVSRALLNWMLRLKDIPPIYIDDTCKQEYYDALSSIDLNADYVPFVLLIEKRIINTIIELHDYLYLE